MKFDLQSYKEISLSAVTDFLVPNFDASGCSCDNVVLEAHYKVFFDELDVNQPNSFVIKDIVVDIVYGKT